MGWGELAAGVIAGYCGRTDSEDEFWLSSGLSKMDEDAISLLLKFAASVNSRFVNVNVATS
ncbi:hypothetical protein ACWGIU_07465 [Streptomyces sp. NPDC054840]